MLLPEAIASRADAVRQLLEHADLIAPAHWYSGNIWYFGYRSTGPDSGHSRASGRGWA